MTPQIWIGHKVESHGSFEKDTSVKGAPPLSGSLDGRSPDCQQIHYIKNTCCGQMLTISQFPLTIGYCVFFKTVIFFNGIHP